MASGESHPRFTVVIPTKDRAPYLFHTLRTCHLQNYDNMDVVVCDDGSTDDTREVVEEAARQDPRIRYATTGRNVGMLDNFEFALDQVQPGFVLALGGDDALLPNGIASMADALRMSGQELLAWPTPTFFYPNTRLQRSQLVLRTTARKGAANERLVESRTFLDRQARELAYVSDAESPMFYVKGVCSTALVDRVRGRSVGGRFYSCATPDGYSGVVLAGEVPRYAFTSRPLSMNGISPSSAGFGYLSEGEEARKQSELFFRQVANRPMHRELGGQPYSPLISLMTADYLLTARDLPGWPGAFTPIDFRSMLRKGLSELLDGLFAQGRIARELSILNGVAEHHGLGDWFRTLVARSHRNGRKPLEGNAFSASRLYIDCEPLGIENIVDAAYFASGAHATAATFGLARMAEMLSNSVRYRLLSLRRGPAIPPESEWVRAGRAPES